MRLSRSSTTKALSVTLTFFAAAVSVGTIEVLMPRLQESGLALPSDDRDSIQLVRAEPVIVRLSNRSQPELGELLVPLHVNVGRLLAVAGKEEEPIRTAPQDGGAH